MSLLPPTQYIGKPVYAKTVSSANINIRMLPTITSSIVGKVLRGQSAGIVESFEQRVEGGRLWTWFRVKGVVPGYVREDVVTLDSGKVAQNKEDQLGNDLLQNLVKTDNDLYHNLLINAETLDRLQKKGRPVSQYESQLNSIVAEYKARQAKIKNSDLVNFQTKFNAAWEWLKKKWSDTISGVGALPLAIPIAIGAAVGLGAGALIYFTFREDYEDSKKNLKESKQLQNVLDSLDGQVAASIREDLETQIDKAYAQGKTEGKLEFFGFSLKNILLIGLGAFAVVKGPELVAKVKKRR